MSDSTGQYKNAFHCAALLLKNEGANNFPRSPKTSPDPNFFRRTSGTLQGLHHVLPEAVGKSKPLLAARRPDLTLQSPQPHSVLSLLVFEQLRKATGLAPI